MINFEDSYFCNSDGSIYSNKSGKLKKLKHGIIKNGYSIVTLSINGKLKTKYVHRIVAENFVSGYSAGLVVNHKDGNKSNNDCSNLEWCTQKENSNHASKIGLIKKRPYLSPKNKNSKLDDCKILAILTMHESGSKIPSREIAKKFNVTKNAILSIRKHINTGLSFFE